MPIYAYRCEACGYAKDVLQKMSDAPLSQCPECGKDAFRKQVTAAGFQLKGSGWYVTDFRGGASGSSALAAGDEKAGDEKAGDEKAGGEKAGGETAAAPAAADSTASAPAASTPAPAAAPASST
ncbi:FmdB family zinc ribbon protein [Burkholderia pseudomallei]|uniref:FmdB family zinc ribbon protein n=1 Tax=Burkholderia pseudomallei TaxID=28450 RepID=UPI00053671C5|nr:FmdB family zinc ribbon protein [Burkholderia pseudomallei]KGV76744.1 regulatory, FmdB family domain protein [Burkholderia pseudomallei MSHR4299]